MSNTISLNFSSLLPFFIQLFFIYANSPSNFFYPIIFFLLFKRICPTHLQAYKNGCCQSRHDITILFLKSKEYIVLDRFSYLIVKKTPILSSNGAKSVGLDIL
jgi:hypothetical protein